MSLASETISTYYGGSWHPVASYTAEEDVSANFIKFYNGSAWRYVDLSSYTSSNRATNARVYRSGSYYSLMSEALAELPSGIVAGFLSVPSGWTPTGWTARFIMAASIHGSTGGDSHTHSVTIPASNTNSSSPSKIVGNVLPSGDSFDYVYGYSTAHSHSISSQAETSGAGTVDPPHYDVIFCTKD